MSNRDPALVVALSASRDGRTIRTLNRNRLRGINLLDTSAGPLRPLATLSTLLLLRKEILDPDRVDSVDGTTEDTSEDEVEEDAVRTRQLR